MVPIGPLDAFIVECFTLTERLTEVLDLYACTLLLGREIEGEERGFGSFAASGGGGAAGCHRRRGEE